MLCAVANTKVGYCKGGSVMVSAIHHGMQHAAVQHSPCKRQVECVSTWLAISARMLAMSRRPRMTRLVRVWLRSRASLVTPAAAVDWKASSKGAKTVVDALVSSKNSVKPANKSHVWTVHCFLGMLLCSGNCRKAHMMSLEELLIQFVLELISWTSSLICHSCDHRQQV